jgi:cbb3-type cytochrome oxidase subunit 3
MEVLRALLTVLVMGVFLAIVWWAYAPSRKADWMRKGQLGDDA